MTIDFPITYWRVIVTKKPKTVYGVYELDELKWYFFSDKALAIDFQQANNQRIGPHPFSFDTAMEQFSNDLCAIPGSPFVTKEEFVKVMRGEDVELSFFSSDNKEEEEIPDETDDEEHSRPEPSEGYFESTFEALLWLRSCCIYILDELTTYASERDDDIEAFDYYDGFLSPLETLVDEYLGDINDFEKTSEGLYEGFFVGGNKEDEDE